MQLASALAAWQAPVLRYDYSIQAYCHGTTVAAPEPQAANRVSRWSWALSGLKPHRPQSVAMAYSDGDTNDMEIMAGIFDEAQHHAFGLILANNYYGYWYGPLSVTVV